MSKSRNIAFFVENYRKGGLEKVFLEKIAKWPKEKNKLTIFCNNIFLNDSAINKYTSNVQVFFHQKG